MYITLPGNAGIWIERGKTSYRAKMEIEKTGGEYLLWFRSWHVIFTPLGWQPRRAKAGLKLAA